MNTVYLQIDQNVKITGESFCLKEIAKISCSDKVLEAKIKVLKLAPKQIQGPGRYVLSVMDVIERIHREYPSAEISSVGESDFIVTLEKAEKQGAAWQWCKTIFVSLVSFFGAAFSIMAFHNDVGITELFSELYELFTGEVSDGFTVLEAAYSFGLGIGILLFFNHFGRKKLTSDPTPLEMQMREYEDQVNTAIIEAESRRGENRRW